MTSFCSARLRIAALPAALATTLPLVLLGTPVGASPPIGQVSRRPDSRVASYPTASSLPPPAPLRFTAGWERELPGERVVQLSPGGEALLALTDTGSLFAFESATGAPLWSASGLDPDGKVLALCGFVFARSSGGKLVAFGIPDGREAVPALSEDIQPSLGSCCSREASAAPPFASTTRAPSGPVSAVVAVGCAEQLTVPLAGSPRMAFVRPSDLSLSAMLSLPGPLLSGPLGAASRLWALTGEKRNTALAALRLESAGGSREAGVPQAGAFALQKRLTSAYLIASDGRPGGRDLAIARAGGILETYDAKRLKRRWRVRLGTDAGAPPLLVETSPGKGSKQEPEKLVVAGTMDGLLAAFETGNGHLAWTVQVASRISRPIAVWLEKNEGNPDRTRLILAGEGSRKLEAFRALDGAAAGSLVMEPNSAVILAGPIILPTAIGTALASPDPAGGREPPRCFIAWSPYPRAGSRLLSLHLSSVP